MAGTVAVREFTSAEEMKAHYAALQRRCFEAPAVVQRAPEPAPVVKDVQVREPEPAPDHWREFVLRSKETYGLVKVRSLEQREGEATLSGADALRIVSEVTGYTEAQLRGQSRLKGVVRARHIAYWMLVNFAGKSFKGAGRMLGDRDHSTVISGSSRADAALMAIEPPLPETPVGVAQLLWVIKWPRLALVNGRIPRISRPRCACCGAPFEAP